MNSLTWLHWALLSAVLAALTAILAKFGLQTINSDFGLLVRTAVVLVALSIFVVLSGKWTAPSTVTLRTWGFLVLSGLATGASWFCYFRALKAGEASRVNAVDKMSVVLVAVLSAILLHERLGPIGWIGVALVAAGGMLIGIGR